MKKIFPIITVFCLLVASCTKEQAEPSVAVTGITLSPEFIELTVGEQKTITATIAPKNATNKNIKFSSSKESVATVSKDGVVEAIAAGKAIVTVTSDDGKFKAHCTVNVLEKIIHVTGIALNKTTLSLKEGDEFTLVPTVTPDNAADKSVNWSSDNEAIVTVSDEGLVKALKAGKATVTATTVDQGKTASCSIEVAEGMSAVTGAATHISCRNAEISGKANLPGTTSTDLSFGVLYSASSGVLIGSATQIEARSFDSDYNYTVNTEVLEPETTYYYRSYIIQDKEISYGELKSFSTLALSSMIQTLDATDINPKDAVLNASLDLTDCKYGALEYGFEVTPEGGSAHTIKSSNHSEKKFSAKDESLSSDTKYSVVAYVKLDGRTYKGEAKTFTTTSVKASITAESSNVTSNTATISGRLTVESEGSFNKSAVLYYSSTASTLETLKTSGTYMALTLGPDGSYSISLSSLVSDTQYNYVVVSYIDGIEQRTEVKSFKTLPIVTSITAEASDISYYNATIFGKLTVESDGSFSKSAVLYYSSTASTLEALKSNGTRKTLTLESDGLYSINLSSLNCDTQYNYVVVAKVDGVEFNTGVKSFKTLEIPELVDLGLSVKWRSWNLGASKPEEYGGYYQWAGTTDVTSTSIYLDYSNCPYHTGSSSSTGWTKYNTRSSYGPVDNKTVLDPEDDVAHVKLGGKWRMPTIEEWEEVKNTSNCSWTWTSINGIDGYKVQSKKAGFTNNWIFLPAAGCRSHDDVNGVGAGGRYWSSSLDTVNPYCANDLYFFSANVYTDHYVGRYYGRSVRPVSD